MPAYRGGPTAAGPAPKPKPPPRVVLPNPDNQPAPAPPAPRVVLPNPDNQPAPAPRPAALPTSTRTAAVAHGAVKAARPPNPYVTKAARQAVLAVFHLQPLKVQGRLARAAAIRIRKGDSQPIDPILVNDVKQRYLSAVEHHQKFPNFLAGTGPSVGSVNGTIFSDAANFLKGLGSPGTTTGDLNARIAQINGVPTTPTGLAKQTLAQATGALGQARRATTPGAGLTPATISAVNKIPTADQVAANAAKDALNLPETALTTAGQVGTDAIHGNLPQVAKDFYGGPLSMLEHPETILQHPLFAYLMATGAIHGASRLAAAPVRALASPDSTLGKIVSTDRPSVTLSGNLTHDRPDYSKSPTVKYLYQKPLDAATYGKIDTRETVPRSSVVRDVKTSAAIGRLAGIAERVRRSGRAKVEAPLARALTPHGDSFVGRNAAKAVYGAKTALAYGSRTALIPGATVLSLIADGTIRRPDTLVEDLRKYADKLRANRGNLTSKGDLAQNAKNLKTIEDALNNKAFLRDPGPAFKAATVYAKLYQPLEASAHGLGHYREMTKENLLRRTLAHYAAAHMDARVDPERGLVVDRVKPDGTTEAVPLPLDEIRKHLQGAEGVAGRPLAFTSDKVISDTAKAERQANYVSGARRVMPEGSKAKPNTLYAYSHGLTQLGHESVMNRAKYIRGVVDSLRSQNKMVHALAIKPEGGWAKDAATIERYIRATPGLEGHLQPFNVATRPFFPQVSLEKGLEEGNVHPADAQLEAMRRGLDLSDRLDTSVKGGQWGMIDTHAVRALNHINANISPDVLTRSLRGMNNWFRTVVLSTSAKHIPGVTQEAAIRMIGQGVGPRSFQAGRAALNRAEQLDPVEGERARITLTGGQQAGMTLAMRTHLLSDNFKGTSIHPVLKAVEAVFKTPGVKQLATAWRGYSNFVLSTTKHLLEENISKAYLGKALLRQHGYADAARVDGFMGLAKRAMGLHGELAQQAARGLLDERKLNQLRSTVDQIGGKWTDFSPAGQRALMYSPFGLWWWNSIKWIARAPVDMPVKTGLFAAANLGTEKARRKEGLDPFAKGGVPNYMQGGIGIGGGSILGQNYYSPFGTVNDPLGTAQSLIEPWATPVVLASLGDNWLGKTLRSPGNPRGYHDATTEQRGNAILGSLLASFMPFYTKAEQVSAGGSSRYDVPNSGLLNFAPTKTPGKGVGAGLASAFKPYRSYNSNPPSSSSSKIGGGSIGGGSIGGGSIGGGKIGG